MRPSPVVKRTGLMAALLCGVLGVLRWQGRGRGGVPVQVIESEVDSVAAAAQAPNVPLTAPRSPLGSRPRVVAVDAEPALSDGRSPHVRARDPSGQAVAGLEVRYRSALPRTRPSEEGELEQAPCWELDYGWGGLVHTDDTGYAQVHDRLAQAKAVAVGGGDWSYSKVLGSFDVEETGNGSSPTCRLVSTRCGTAMGAG